MPQHIYPLSNVLVETGPTLAVPDDTRIADLLRIGVATMTAWRNPLSRAP
jgi:hypothetical protein